MNTPEDEKNDPVWDLLNQARPSDPSPFFSRNVVREIRRLEAERPTSPLAACWAWIRQPLVAGPAMALLVIGAITLAVSSFPDDHDGGAPVAQVEPASPAPASGSDAVEGEFDPASEITNLAYLGEVMAVTDPSMLDDAALADLLF